MFSNLKSTKSKSAYIYIYIYIYIALISFVIGLLGIIGINLGANASSFPEVQEQTIEGNSATTHMALKADDTKLSFICPSVINFAMKANGEFIVPNDGIAYIENLSLMPLRMKSYTVTSDPAAKGMIDTTGTTDDNAYEVKIKTQLGNPTPFAVTQNALTSSEWSMTKAGGDTPKLNLAFSDGKMVNITNHWGSGAHLQDVVWNVTADINNQVTVQFDSTGGSVIPDQTLTTGGKATVPDIPTKEGYEFDGWYTDSACTQPFDFEGTAINQYTLLFAKWKGVAKEAYAVVRSSSANVTDDLLEFRYDGNRGTYPEDHTFDCLDTGAETAPGWHKFMGEPMSQTGAPVTTVIFTNEFKNVQVKSCYRWFHNPGYEGEETNLTKFIGMENFDTSEVTNMEWMFDGCSKLTDLDVSHFDTSKVAGMNYMFAYCANLTNLNVSNFDTHKVESTSWMFYNCQSLINLDVSHFDTRKVTDTSGMFSNCSGLTNLDVSNFNTSNVEDMAWMFSDCTNLQKFPDISTWDVTNVPWMAEMFSGCEKAKDFKSPNFKNINIDCPRMFYNCYELETLDISTLSYHPDMGGYNGICNRNPKLYEISVGENFDAGDDGRIELPSGPWYNKDTGERYENESQFPAGVKATYTKINPVHEDVHVNFYRTYENEWGGEETELVEAQTLPFNSKITSIPVVTREDFKFLNWGLDLTQHKKAIWNFNDTVKYDINLYTNWEREYAHVYFDTVGGSDVPESQRVKVGEKCAEPVPAPTKDDKAFIGWWTGDRWDEGDDNVDYYDKWDFNEPVTDNMTLYAKWAPSHVTVIFKTYGATPVPETQVIGYGEKATRPAVNPSRTDFVFEGWKGENEEEEWDDFDFENTPLYNDTTITAKMKFNYDLYGVRLNGTLTLYCDNERDQKEGEQFYNIDINSVTPAGEWIAHQEIYHVVIDPSFKKAPFHSLCRMFGYMPQVEDFVGLENINTNEVTNMVGMFEENATRILDVSHFDTSKVTDTRSMFNACRRLSNLDITNFNTSNVTDMSCMFENCWTLTSLDVTSFNTSKVTDMSYMFGECSNLRTINLMSWNVENVKSMNEMFCYCYSLKNIYLDQNWTENEKLQGTDGMFSGTQLLHGADEEEWEEGKPYCKPVAEGGNFSPIPETCTVTFDSQGGTEVPSQVVSWNAKCVEPPAPTKEGFVFAGWSIEDSEIFWDFDKEKVDRDITLRAVWGIEKSIVTFDSMGGEPTPSQQEVFVGNKVQRPSDPTKEGYDLVGWYTGTKWTDEEGIEHIDYWDSWDFDREIQYNDEAEITLYAKWQKQGDSSFSTDWGDSFQFNNGMTWRDFVNSDFNDGSWSIDDDSGYVIYQDYYWICYSYDYDTVSPDSQIEPNYEYILW